MYLEIILGYDQFNTSSLSKYIVFHYRIFNIGMMNVVVLWQIILFFIFVCYLYVFYHCYHILRDGMGA